MACVSECDCVWLKHIHSPIHSLASNGIDEIPWKARSNDPGERRSASNSSSSGNASRRWRTFSGFERLRTVPRTRKPRRVSSAITEPATYPEAPVTATSFAAAADDMASGTRVMDSRGAGRCGIEGQQLNEWSWLLVVGSLVRSGYLYSAVGKISPAQSDAENLDRATVSLRQLPPLARLISREPWRKSARFQVPCYL